jgi:hypothetical protein
MKKLIGILVITLLIVTGIPTIGISNNYSNEEINSINYLHRNSISTSQNGVILAQELDENNKGYSIIRISGSHYEMGYAQAELLGEYIVIAVNEIKEYAADNYNQVRDLMSESIWLPQDIEDEFNGMVDSLSNNFPSENIDNLDIKVLNTFGDWGYGFSCRSHTCWGRYVSEPIKTLSTRRLDFASVTPSANHHVLCARDPNDGSLKWVNLGPPGYILTPTSINEFGILVSSHDYNSYDTDFIQGRIPRMVIFRYVTTFATNPDLSTHLNDIYYEMQKYEIMTGGFLNYYAPEGFGGVMTFNPLQSGPDLYHLRTPQESWHHGEAMITTNSWTDGTYTPEDEDFDADLYYNDESPKTHESHWNLLDKSGLGNRNLHMLSIAYRGPSDMTIWAEGKINSLMRTPRLEWEWYDLFNAEPPTIPDINGESKGNNGDEYEYSFSSTDGNDDDIFYHINWGDDSDEEIIGPESSGDIVTAKHIWVESGRYTIKAMAKDTTGLESEWATLEVSMPKNKSISGFNPWIIRLIQRFPILELII